MLQHGRPEPQARPANSGRLRGRSRGLHHNAVLCQWITEAVFDEAECKI